MSGPVLLNNVDHADLKVVLERGARYGDAINQAPVFPTEFEALQREYAIVLRRDPEGAFRAMALLGFESGENLYLDGDRWDARAMPAVMSRGPFSIGAPPPGEAGEPMIHIDPDHPRVSREHGAAIFKPHGGNSAYLDGVAEVLQRIYVGSQTIAPMLAAFAAHDLIEPVTLDIEIGDGRRYAVPDCHTISLERLAALDGAALAALNAHDFLRPAIWLRSSLGNVPALAERKLCREAGAR